MKNNLGFNRNVGEIDIIIDEDGDILFASVSPELVDLILELDSNNEQFLKIKEQKDN